MSSQPEFTADNYPVAVSEAKFVMDEDAFRAFYERTARGIWAYLARVTNDPQLADDLLQETYYRFLRARASHHTETHRRNSLYKIATNLARDARRRKRAEPENSADQQAIDTAPARDGGRSAEGVADLNRALERMLPRERAMLWLAYAEGASHNEIAAIMGMRPASLKTLLFRARRRLAGLLKGAVERETP
ncbi:MAG: RNA polymerase sigma factor [Bryobacterales bacterium]|nr:RNA polymerase sigma factor [Bryobacterales bacterium]